VVPQRDGLTLIRAHTAEAAEVMGRLAARTGLGASRDT
jgi:hypothetical protein